MKSMAGASPSAVVEDTELVVPGIWSDMADADDRKLLLRRPNDDNDVPGGEERINQKLFKWRQSRYIFLAVTGIRR